MLSSRHFSQAPVRITLSYYIVSKNDKTQLADWKLTSDYGIHPSTRTKLIRQDVLKVRELGCESGSVYFRAYLVEENKEFFEKYLKIYKENPTTIQDIFL
ncbi:MAG: hypothetical protein WC988_01395 [Patescibacteria group bacterium]